MKIDMEWYNINRVDKTGVSAYFSADTFKIPNANMLMHTIIKDNKIFFFIVLSKKYSINFFRPFKRVINFISYSLILYKIIEYISLKSNTF